MTNASAHPRVAVPAPTATAFSSHIWGPISISAPPFSVHPAPRLAQVLDGQHYLACNHNHGTRPSSRYSSLAARPAQSAWEGLERAIREMETLGKGWDGYEAEPPNAVARSMARLTLEILQAMNFVPDRVVPSVEGGIGVCFLRRGKYADVECLNTGEIVAVVSDLTGHPRVWQVSSEPREIEDALDCIRAHAAD